MSKEYEEKEHPSFGAIAWSRVRGNPGPFFLSSLLHESYIEVEIKEAIQIRSLNETRLSTAGKPSIIQVRMTEAQFAQFITTPNQGPGVPCTLASKDRKPIEKCPPDEQMTAFRKDMDLDARIVTQQANKALEQVHEMLGGKTVRKADLKALKGVLEKVVREVEANMPYLVTTFQEYMDDVYHDAMAQFESHVKVRARELGLEQMVKGQKALGGADGPKT